MGEFGSGLKSVQRGEATITGASGTVTITAVVLAKSFLVFSSNDVSYYNLKGYLTNTTTITFTRGGADGSCSVAWEVMEYY